MFEFLNTVGKSKDEFIVLDLDKKYKEAIEYVDILVNRKLMQNDFKEELLNYYFTKKINESKFFENTEKSIAILEKAEFKLVSLDDSFFKLRNDTQEYVGTLDRLPNRKESLPLNSGKVSYTFIVYFYEHIKNRILTLKEILAFSDSLHFNFFAVINVEQIKIPSELDL